MQHEINITSLKQTAAFAEKLASQLSAGDILALKGDLGAGKTTFCRYLISSLLGKETHVTSPTFQLLKIYTHTVIATSLPGDAAIPCGMRLPLRYAPRNDGGNDITIYHYDLYRLKHEEEHRELAIEEALNDKNIVIIEWPEIIMHILPKKIIEIEILLENKNRKCIVMDHSNKLSL